MLMFSEVGNAKSNACFFCGTHAKQESSNPDQPLTDTEFTSTQLRHVQFGSGPSLIMCASCATKLKNEFQAELNKGWGHWEFPRNS